jgi:hypothetical protein
MKRFMFLVMAMFLANCATTGGTKSAPSAVGDVAVGDKLQVTEEGRSDCSMVVESVVTLMPTQQGWSKIPPIVCGVMTCVSSVPELAQGEPLCASLDIFQDQTKKKTPVAKAVRKTD